LKNGPVVLSFEPAYDFMMFASDKVYKNGN
jgi:hypothetical protein